MLAIACLSSQRAMAAAEVGDAAEFTRWGHGGSELRSQSKRLASAAVGEMCHDIVRNQPELAAALRSTGLLDDFKDEDSDEDDAQAPPGPVPDDGGAAPAAAAVEAPHDGGAAPAAAAAPAGGAAPPPQAPEIPAEEQHAA
jgi:hypothetical protein